MTDAEVLAAIQANHLKANISSYEEGMDGAVIHWDQAWIDPGFGGDSGPYAKVPITLNYTPEEAKRWRDFLTGIRVERGLPPGDVSRWLWRKGRDRGPSLSARAPT